MSSGAKSFFDTAGGLMFRRRDASSRPRTLSGVTFEGLPFSVRLESDIAFDRGASAQIHKGHSSGGPWNQPRLVAVKVFGQMLNPVQQEVLLRELRTASHASLRHSRILEFLGTVDVGGQKALVSNYMHNGNLLEYLKSNPGSDKKKLIVQVAEGIEYLHTHARIVHGDLKCENVLISDSGDALLADFGLSTSVERSQFNVTTMTGIREMNTIRFAAPELLQGSDDPTVRPRSKTVESDVYAFGMLILQALTELPPWFDQNTMAVMQKVCQGLHPPQPTSNSLVTISHSWWYVCLECWSTIPRDRPSIVTVLGALKHADLEPHHLLERHQGAVSSVAYLPGGHRVVSGDDLGVICVWNIHTGRAVIGPLRAHRDQVSCVAVSPNGRHICSGSLDRTIRLWDAESGAPVGRPMTGHDDYVNGVAYSPDGMRIVSCSDDTTVRLWDATTAESLGDRLVGHAFWVCAAAFSPDGTCIASWSLDKTIRIWDSATGVTLRVLPHNARQVTRAPVCFSPDGIQLVFDDRGGVIRIWNIPTGQRVRNIHTHPGQAESVAVSPSGRYIASGFPASIQIWDAHTGEAVGAPLSSHGSRACSLAFSPDERSRDRKSVV